MNTPRVSPVDVEHFLRDIDPTLEKYASEFRRLDFVNTNHMKFLKRGDLEKFTCKVSDVHRRMLLNAVAKLQTPCSKLGLRDEESPKSVEGLQTDNFFKPRKLSYKQTREVGENSESPSPSSSSACGSVRMENMAPTNFLDTYKYKSPIDRYIEQRQEEVRLLERELNLLEERHLVISKKYCHPSSRLPGEKQCGKCHLYGSHRRDKCPNGPCKTAEQCGDVNAKGHEVEKAELNDIVSKIQKTKSDVKSKQQTIDIKRQAQNSIKNSFSERVHDHLIRSNQEKYLFLTSAGEVVVRTQELATDKAILQKYYKGKIPENIEVASGTFRAIIEEFNNTHRQDGVFAKPRNNPIKEKLESNPVFPVKFPTSRATCDSSEDKSSDDVEDSQIHPVEQQQLEQAIQNSLHSSRSQDRHADPSSSAVRIPHPVSHVDTSSQLSQALPQRQPPHNYFYYDPYVQMNQYYPPYVYYNPMYGSPFYSSTVQPPIMPTCPAESQEESEHRAGNTDGDKSFEMQE